MASAPDRISIKRRRDDEVVNILALASSKKQRLTGQYFVRLGHQGTTAIPNSYATSQILRPVVNTVQPPAGVPTVATTLPGDEIQDFLRYKIAQSSRNGVPSNLANASTLASHTQTRDILQAPADARRFHLTRDLSLAPRSRQNGTSSKSRPTLRPHLPTFIERSQGTSAQASVTYAEPPVDRIIRSVDGANHELDARRIMSKDGSVTREKTSTFQKSRPVTIKNGQSIRDDPATWDLTSDRLADELMTLALEMDPDARAAYEAESKSRHNTVLSGMDSDTMLLDTPDDFVYETYVRVQGKGIASFPDLTASNNLGYLVIDEEQEDLWEQYLNDDEDEDDEWEEEDADSNAEDNPRNDYPEDEVSSDDEYGGNLYKYRHDYSDDEQYDHAY